MSVSSPSRVVTLIKDQESFLFVYTPDSIPTLHRTLHRYAEDPERNFSRYDAAVVYRQAIGTDVPNTSTSGSRFG